MNHILNSTRDKYSGMFNGSRSVESRPVQDKKDFLDRAIHYYGMYCSDMCSIGFGGVRDGRRFSTLREYGRGRQNVRKYMDILDPLRSIKGSDKKVRRWNISWSPVNVFPKYRSQIKDRILNLNLDIQIDIDNETVNKEKRSILHKMLYLVDEKTRELVNEVGVEPPQAKMVEGMTSKEDVQLYAEMGGIKLDVEIMLQDSVIQSFKKKEWDDVASMLIDDEIDLGIYAVEPYLYNGEIKFRYIDPEYLVVGESTYSDHRDSNFWGYIRFDNKRNVLMNVEEEDYAKIDKFKAQSSSPSVNYEDRRSFLGLNNIGNNWRGRYGQEDGVLPVFTIYFVAPEERKYATGRYKTGNNVYYEIKGKPKKDLESEEVIVHNLYKAEWVIGTDVVFNYGLADLIVRDGAGGLGEVCPPIIIQDSEIPSITDQLIGSIDDMNIAIFKLRNIYSNLPPPPRVLIDKSAFNDIMKISGQDVTMKEALREFKTTGAFVVESRGAYSIPGVENDMTKRSPITPLNISYSEDINALLNEISRAFNNIRLVTGFNDVTDGYATNPDTLKHVAAGAQVATNSSLSEIVRRWTSFNRDLAYNISKKYIIMMAVGDYNLEKKLGISIIDFLSSGIGIRMRIDDTDMRDALKQDLLSKRDIIPSTLFYSIYRAINDGDYLKAQIMIAKEVERANELAHQRQMQIATAQSEASAKAAQVTAQSKLQIVEAEKQKEKELLILEYELNKNNPQK